MRTGKAHPELGDGSLISLLMKKPMAPQSLATDPEFLSSMRIAVEAILTHTACQPKPAQKGNALVLRLNRDARYGRSETQGCSRRSGLDPHL